MEAKNKIERVFSTATINKMAWGTNQQLFSRLHKNQQTHVRIITIFPNNVSSYHNHSEQEVWILIAGDAYAEIEGQPVKLIPQKPLIIPPLMRHRIVNMKAESTILAIWYHDEKYLQQSKILRIASTKYYAADTPKHQLIIPAIVTPNGPLHLGHISGPYLLADILQRVCKMQDIKASLLMGTLGHQEQIAIAAEKIGKSYYAAAEHYTESIYEGFERLAIKPDVFLCATPSKRFREIVHDIYQLLHAKNYIEGRITLTPFDNRSGKFVVDARVKGKCPHCMAITNGLECEQCGNYLLDKDLGSPTTVDGVALTLKPLFRLYINLACMQEKFQKYIHNLNLSAQADAYIKKWLSKGLPVIAITAPLSHGIDVPHEHCINQMFTVAFEHVARYLIAIEKLFNKQGRHYSWRQILQENQFELNVLFGFDNAFARLLVVPCILLALGLDDLLPKQFYLNHFMALEKEKFSTSRNHAIWVNEFVNVHNQDALRFYLTLVRPQDTSSVFKMSEFNQFEQDFWQNTLLKLIEKIFKLVSIAATDDNDMLLEAGQWSKDDILWYNQIVAFDDMLKKCYQIDWFNPVNVSREIHGFIKGLHNYVYAIFAWPNIESALLADKRTQVRMVVRSLISLCVALYPIAPTFVTKISQKFDGKLLPQLSWLDENWFTSPLKKFQPFYFSE